jgi:hypothetical protein
MTTTISSPVFANPYDIDHLSIHPRRTKPPLKDFHNAQNMGRTVSNSPPQMQHFSFVVAVLKAQYVLKLSFIARNSSLSQTIFV